MRYFDDIFSVEAIKAHYKELAFKHHPDRGGETATMQAINAQYHEALKRCNGQSSEGANGKEHTYRYNETVEQSVIDKISWLVGARLPDVKIALIGTWLWVTGDTKPWKDLLKANGLKWHPVRQCWYYTATPHYGRQSKYGLQHLAMRYGYQEFRDDNKRKQVSH